MQSMSRKDNGLDNAVIENWFGHVKEEVFRQTAYTSSGAFIHALNKYIAWYNTDRISTTLKGLSQVEYRTQALAA